MARPIIKIMKSMARAMITAACPRSGPRSVASPEDDLGREAAVAQAGGAVGILDEDGGLRGLYRHAVLAGHQAGPLLYGIDVLGGYLRAGACRWVVDVPVGVPCRVGSALTGHLRNHDRGV